MSDNDEVISIPTESDSDSEDDSIEQLSPAPPGTTPNIFISKGRTLIPQ